MATDTLESGDEGVLVLAPLGRDAELASAALAAAGFQSVIGRDLPEIMDKLATMRGAVLLAEEAITPAGMAQFAALFRAQPAWSDLPIFLLTSGGNVADANSAAVERFGQDVNVTLLERPPPEMIRLTSSRSSMIRVCARACRSIVSNPCATSA